MQLKLYCLHIIHNLKFPRLRPDYFLTFRKKTFYVRVHFGFDESSWINSMWFIYVTFKILLKNKYKKQLN